MHCAHHWQTTNELWNHSELQEIFWQYLREQFARILIGLRFNGGVETNTLVTNTLLNDLFEARESAATNEQHVGGVDLNEFLVRMLATTLWRNRSNGSFENLQQCLLNTFARHVTSNAGVFCFTRNLVDFVDVHDALFCTLHIEVRCL